MDNTDLICAQPIICGFLITMQSALYILGFASTDSQQQIETTGFDWWLVKSMDDEGWLYSYWKKFMYVLLYPISCKGHEHLREGNEHPAYIASPSGMLVQPWQVREGQKYNPTGEFQQVQKTEMTMYPITSDCIGNRTSELYLYDFYWVLFNFFL